MTKSHFIKVLPWSLAVAVIVAGLLLTPQYGESWDERQFYKYADNALSAYATWPTTGSVPITGNTYDNYGPAYVIFAALAARLLGFVIPWSISDLRHLVYFLSFAGGMLAFYRLARRWLSVPAALGGVLLLATQPVVWGHAFISPKDVPFLTFVVLSLLLGLEMIDRHAARSKEAAGVPLRLIWASVGWIILVGLLILITPVLRSSIQGLVQSAAAGQQNLVSSLASDIGTADPAVYVEKFFVLALRLRAAAIILGTALLAFFWRRVPGAFSQLIGILPAGLALGFSTSIRILGPIAAVFVGIYAFSRLGRRAIPVLAAYAGIALSAMYLSWPYLWPDPLGHLVESIRVMSQYPWKGSVLFNGVLYPSTGLPVDYLPRLLGIQLSETSLLLIITGAVLALLDAVHRRAGRSIAFLALGWFAIPLAGFILTRTPLYDNFRQVLFILPPLFLLCGLAFERIPRRSLQWVLIGLALLPGLVDGIRLHPYEYIYYNRLVGGVQGAFRHFELDYWGISYREAAAHLNQVAPPNSAVWVEGPTHLLQLYARPDLKIYSTYESERAAHYDYVVALTRFDLDLQAYPESPVIHVVERQGALLTVIKKP